jgi:hypothetical protein
MASLEERLERLENAIGQSVDKVGVLTADTDNKSLLVSSVFFLHVYVYLGLFFVCLFNLTNKTLKGSLATKLKYSFAKKLLLFLILHYLQVY